MSVLLLGLTFVSCNDDFDTPPMVVPQATHQPNMTIADFKAKYWKDVNNYIDTVKEDIVIHGWVTANDVSGNIYKSLYISDGTAGFSISINGTSLYNTYRIGQEIVLPVTGLFIGKYNTLQQLGYPDYSDTYGWQATFLPLAMFQEAAELNGLPNAAEIDTISVKMAELPTTPDGIRKMQSQLVRFDGVSFVEADGKTPEALGQLIYFFEYACGLSGYLLDVNPFDQPGVEAYKKNMFALLGKPGYEDRKAELEAKLKK